MLVVLSADQLRSPSGKVLSSLKRIDSRCRLEAEFTKGKPWDSMQVDQCRDDVAVEAIPNDYTQGIIRSLRVQLQIHTGRTRKSLRAEELKNIDGNWDYTREIGISFPHEINAGDYRKQSGVLNFGCIVVLLGTNGYGHNILAVVFVCCSDPLLSSNAQPYLRFASYLPFQPSNISKA